MPNTTSPYGASGGGLQSRMAVEGDAREAIPLSAAGTMDVSSPPHLLGLKGSAYKAGALTLGGHRNLIHNGGEAHSIYAESTQSVGVSRSFTLGLSTNSITDLASTSHTKVESTPFALATTFILNSFGDMIFTTANAVNLPAINEAFAGLGGGTVAQVTNGSPTIDFSGGTTLLTANLTASYTYTPSKTLIKPGDIVAITQGPTVYFHRIVQVVSATRLTVYPNWGGTTAGPAAGLGYSVLRTGYGSYSRVVQIENGASTYCYYAGNSVDSSNYGTVECYVLPANTHFMCPQSAAADVQADDIILYKGYLLYGAGTAVRWTKVGFPNTFPFDAADFPATQTTVVDNSDHFVCFEQIGDQVVAMFTRSIWLVYPTGGVPEFNFYRLPEPIGVNQILNVSPQTSTVVYGRKRPTVSGRATVYYLAKSGLMATQGGPSVHVSETVDAFWQSSATPDQDLSWEPVTDSVIWGSSATGLIYTNPTQSWSVYDLSFKSGTPCGVTGEVLSGSGKRGQVFRRFGAGYYDSNAATINYFNNATGGIDYAQSNGSNWSWSPPVLNLSDAYDKFTFGGFRIDGRGNAAGGITWSVYGGSSPYNMTLKASGVNADYTSNGRSLLGKKLDDAFVAIVLAGTNWSGLSGVLIYNADYKAAR